MKKEIIETIERLSKERDNVLELYCKSLESWTPEKGSGDAIERAAILHDLDRHVTNLELEVKRIEAQERMIGGHNHA